MATKHFDSSVVKITTEGERVLSSFLAEGERLVSDVVAEIRGKAEAQGESVPESTATAAATDHDALGIEPQQDPTNEDPAPVAAPEADPVQAEPVAAPEATDTKK